MQLNPISTDSNGVADFLQNLSNVARKAGSTAPAGSTTGGSSAQYFNQLLNQISQNLQISGGMNAGSAQNKAQSSLFSKL